MVLSSVDFYLQFLFAEIYKSWFRSRTLSILYLSWQFLLDDYAFLVRLSWEYDAKSDEIDDNRHERREATTYQFYYNRNLYEILPWPCSAKTVYSFPFGLINCVIIFFYVIALLNTVYIIINTVSIVFVFFFIKK